MNITLLTIGTELTRGDLLDANSQWLAAELGNRGYEVSEIRTVDDDDERIMTSLRELAARSTVLIVTGGLGPTSDDRTTQCVAQVLGVPLVRDEPTLAKIREIFARHGRVMHAMNEKQADFPAGAVILDNALGTAAGFSVTLSSALCFFTPGVPAEMRYLFETGILPRLPAPERPLCLRRLTVFGVPESQVAGHLLDLEERFGITLGYRAAPSEIEVKLVASAGSTDEPPDTVERLLDRALVDVQTRLAEYITCPGRVSLAEMLLRELATRGQTVGLAESCTGGQIAAALTRIPGASASFHGSVVAYDNRVKRDLLGVSAASLERFGAVSREVALEMAEGVRRALGVDLGLSVTGIAGPGGGTPEKPVGLVHYAVSGPHGAFAEVATFRGDREQVQKRALAASLFLGLTHLRTAQPWSSTAQA